MDRTNGCQLRQVRNLHQVLMNYFNAITKDVARNSAFLKIIMEDEVIVWNGLNKPADRKTKEERVEKLLKVEVTDSARGAIARYLHQSSSNHVVEELRIGTPCRNSGCDKVYAGPEFNLSECISHPGQAVFHEGMKYWSCCQRKTSNFNAFLSQEGCAKVQHQWSTNEKVDNVRDDWFSSNGNITINIYCKGALPDDLSVSSDGQMLRVHVVYGFGRKETDIIYDLWGEIVCEDSKVVVGERKVGIFLVLYYHKNSRKNYL
uniref:CHORD domain-containing protein n=1 Tax=Heterorhabditis bacteriophora TaxID=37862 RepID=A0A1I7XRP7_HETBA